jgi:hypothetical protein
MTRHAALSIALLLFAGSRLLADDANASPPERTAKQKEDSCWKVRYSKCDGVVRSADLVFVYPTGSYKRDAARAIKKLQAGWNVLKSVTGIDPVKTLDRESSLGFGTRAMKGARIASPARSWKTGPGMAFPARSGPSSTCLGVF